MDPQKTHAQVKLISIKKVYMQVRMLEEYLCTHEVISGECSQCQKHFKNFGGFNGYQCVCNRYCLGSH